MDFLTIGFSALLLWLVAIALGFVGLYCLVKHFMRTVPKSDA